MRGAQREAWAVATVVGLLACGGAALASVAPQSSTTPALPAGRYCYFVEAETISMAASLVVDEYGEIAGTTDAVVYDDANAYYTSYGQDVVGTLEGSTARLQVTTWIEYDVQDSDEEWSVSTGSLENPQATLPAIPCEQLDATLPGLGDSGGWTVEGDAGYPVHYRRVQMDPGYSTITYRHGVVRGERDIYLLRARQGQVLTVWITALEDNAVVDVVTPDRDPLATEVREARLELTENGEYEIWVGGTRGNASYELVLALR